MTSTVRVYTPIKRLPLVIGKLPNGERIPFGPYTTPQLVAGVILAVLTWIATMTLPGNPAVIAGFGAMVTIAVVVMLRAIPYTGVRLTSRMLWIGRLVIDRRPISASGMPLGVESARHTLYIEESVAPILNDWAEPVDDVTQLPRAG
ncbi:hypothetical protein [Nocardia brasiliensis]|uniref:hypothetical protein n=1 Tax=Nocardia brasiliensis TaxID=37326 RepID=UPI002453B000|nr:hypothetical protein [Nocardia brasiliensis]